MWSPVIAEAAQAAEEWDGDEVFLMLVSAIIFVFGIFLWARWLLSAGTLGREKASRGVMVFAILVSLGMLAVVTWFWTAKEIRHGQPYTLLVLAMGGAWLVVCSALFRWLGLSVREDACERRNRSAALAVSGALVGAMFIYCGANTGEGPSFWNNVFSASLGGAVWFALWQTLEDTTKVSHAITEDRNVAAGVRLGAFLMAEGLVLGRALSGNWHSVGATTRDLMRDGWPALVLLVLAVILERMLRPTATNPFPAWPTRGVPAALLYVAAAMGWVLKLGWWEGVPQ